MEIIFFFAICAGLTKMFKSAATTNTANCLANEGGNVLLGFLRRKLG